MSICEIKAIKNIDKFIPLWYNIYRNKNRKEKTMIKLSDLNGDERILCENDNAIIYVDDLRRDLEMSPNDLYGKYFTTISETLRFDARKMIEEFIQSYEECGDGYEDMTERCMNDIDDEDIEQIQKILDKISLSTESFVSYTPCYEIDIWK